MNGCNFTIRKMKKEDISSVAEIEAECFSSPWSEDGLAAELSNDGAEFFVLEKNGTVEAYMGMHIVLDECYIANVAVRNSARKQGFGSALVRNALEVSAKKGCSFITLEVRTSNSAAISLYEKSGFSPVGERKNFYSAPTENALIMTKFF